METSSRYKVSGFLSAWIKTVRSVSAPVTLKLKVAEYCAQVVVTVFVANKSPPAESV